MSARGNDGFMFMRRIPLAFMFTLLMQAAAAVWWASATAAQDNARDQRIGQIEARAGFYETRQIEIIERLARLEAHAESQNLLLRQIAAQTARK